MIAPSPVEVDQMIRRAREAERARTIAIVEEPDPLDLDCYPVVQYDWRDGRLSWEPLDDISRDAWRVIGKIFLMTWKTWNRLNGRREINR
jgi:hypothetical protein